MFVKIVGILDLHEHFSDLARVILGAQVFQDALVISIEAFGRRFGQI